MKVVLFCGGLGTRIRDYSESIPKPMIHIGYRPVLWHLMKYYAHFGHHDFILCLGYRGDAIKQYFLDYNECLSNDFVLSEGGKRIELVGKDKPLLGKAAKSVVNETSQKPWIRVGLRGERPLGEATRLRFSYRLSGTDRLQLVLANPQTKMSHPVELKGLKKDEWATATIDIPGPRAGDRASELQFLLPADGALLIDDLLLYAPGDSK